MKLRGTPQLPEANSFENRLRQRLMCSSPGSSSPALVDASILMCDIRGFTRLSEKFTASEIFDVLNAYYTRLLPLIDKYNGTVDKFIGDAVMAVFPAETPQQVLDTLRCAIALQVEMELLNEEFENSLVDSLHMGIGINTGKVAAGFLGSDLYSEFTVIGSEVNLASRVESYSMRGQILISENTYSICHRDIEIGSTYYLLPKGKTEKIRVYELTGISMPDFLQVPRVTRRKYVRVNVDLNLNFNIVEGKNITDRVYDAHVFDISYCGMGMCVKSPLELLTDIRLLLSMSILGTGTTEIYGKIMHCEEDVAGFRHGLEFTAIDDRVLNAIETFIDTTIAGNGSF